MARYRVLAFSTATLLVVLVLAGIPLQLAAGRPALVHVVGTIHGFLYIGYLVVAFDLTRRLGMPKWQMVLVLLAGTVPFCAFVAERKLTRRFHVTTGDIDGMGERDRTPLGARAAAFRRRWLSRRALLLHLGVAVLAPACAAAGWWQATRALGGHTLSWFYSVEWPIFSLLALAGWWHLVHEDPEVYRARRRPQDPAPGDPHAPGRSVGAPEGRAGRAPGQAQGATLGAAVNEAVNEAANEAAGAAVGPVVARMASVLSMAIAADFVLGVIGVFAIPFSRPSGWLPSKGEAVYVAHAGAGLLVVAGAVGLVVVARGGGRTARIVAWMGLVCVGVAAAGGVLTEAQSLSRFFGIALMFAGSALSIAAYAVPSIVRLQARALASAPGPGDERLSPPPPGLSTRVPSAAPPTHA